MRMQFGCRLKNIFKGARTINGPWQDLLEHDVRLRNRFITSDFRKVLSKVLVIYEINYLAKISLMKDFTRKDLRGLPAILLSKNPLAVDMSDTPETARLIFLHNKCRYQPFGNFTVPEYLYNSFNLGKGYAITSALKLCLKMAEEHFRVSENEQDDG